MEIRKPKYNELGTIDCEINHPDYGWIPFTADPNDCEELGRNIYAEIKEGKHGDIAPHDQHVPTDEEKAYTARYMRDSLIADLEPRLLRYERQERLGIETNDTEAWYLAALQYAQDLRDVPQQEGFPTDIVWPDMPELNQSLID